MEKPKNPYRPKSLAWVLMEEDWSDLNIHQIAWVMGTSYYSVAATINRIEKDTGYKVPYVKLRERRNDDS